jgi:NosR/NirI family nitrous oxide reductase transcriptional regulator
VLGVDAISGATVTVIAQNQVMMPRAAPWRARSASSNPTVRDPARFAVTGGATTGHELVRGGVQRLVGAPEQVGLPGPEPFIELWFGDLNHPDCRRAACWATTAGPTCARA